MSVFFNLLCFYFLQGGAGAVRLSDRLSMTDTDTDSDSTSDGDNTPLNTWRVSHVISPTPIPGQ